MIIAKKIVKRISNFFRENKLVCVLFILSTLFYIYQHYSYLSWDFSAYVLNSRYLFSDGTYFESQRPPLATLIIGTFIFLGKGAEYLYIIMVSSLFLYTSMKSADSFFRLANLNFDREFARFVFYFFSLSIFSLLLGLKEGTELLTLAFLELFLVQLFEGKISGAYLGLAFLARYQTIIFFPLLIFSGYFKKILKNVFIFILIIFPWFLLTFVSYGNWFTSFVDGYAQNVALRESGFMPFDFNDVVKVGGVYLITAFFGIVIFLLRMRKISRDWWKENKVIILMFIVSFIIIYSYYIVPFKFARYLFNLILPIAFFSSVFILTLIKEFKRLKIYKNYIFLLLFFIFIVTIIITTGRVYYERNSMDKFFDAAQDIKRFEIGDCEILSPHWVPVSYFTENVYPLGENLPYLIEKNKMILIFNEETLDDSSTESEISSLPVFYRSDEYTFYAGQDINENCSKKYIYNRTYVKEHCKFISERFAMLGLDSLIQKICESINLRS